MPAWIGTWTHGRIRQGRNGPVWVLEGSWKGRRFARALRVSSDREAVEEYAKFTSNPAKYLGDDRAIRLVPEGKWLDAFLEYSRSDKQSANYVQYKESYLKQWAEFFDGRDIRDFRTADLVAQLDEWKTARHKRIVTLRAWTDWLRRDRVVLDRHEDPTLDLAVPQAKPEKERRSKLIDRKHAMAVYRAITSRPYVNHAGEVVLTETQHLRDVYRLLATLGVHISEIDRFARGEGTLFDDYEQALDDEGYIVGVLWFHHKSGKVHPMSVAAETLAAAKRLRAAGRMPDDGFVSRMVDSYCKRLKLPTINLGSFRHSRSTWERAEGSRLVLPRRGGGISVGDIAKLRGHDPKTQAIYYQHVDRSVVPPMSLVADFELWHPDDPPVPGRIAA